MGGGGDDGMVEFCEPPTVSPAPYQRQAVTLHAAAASPSPPRQAPSSSSSSYHAHNHNSPLSILPATPYVTSRPSRSATAAALAENFAILPARGGPPSQYHHQQQQQSPPPLPFVQSAVYPPQHPYHSPPFVQHQQQQQQQQYAPPPHAPRSAPRASELEELNEALAELERKNSPPWYRRLSTWFLVLAAAAVLILALLGAESWRVQNDMRERIESQQVRLRELGLDSAMHHHGESATASLLPATTRKRTMPSLGTSGGAVPREESRDVLDSAWSAKIEILSWDRVGPGSAANESSCAAPFSRAQHASSSPLAVPRLDACTFVDSPGSFSWDDLERFDLCCLGEHYRLLCGIPSEVAPLSGERASLALYESSASLELARRARRCTLYVVVES